MLSPNPRQFIRCALLVLCLALLSTPGAFAQDKIGVYWDQGYTQNKADTTAPFEMLNGYVVIHDPTSGGGILAWECEFDVDGPGTFASWQIEGQAINAASPPRFAVGLAAPLPPASDTQVASFQFLVTEVAPVAISLKPLFFASVENEMSYLGADNPETLTIMRTVTEMPLVATVNEGVPVFELSRSSIQFGTQPIGMVKTEFLQVTNAGSIAVQLDITLACAGPGYSLPGLSGPSTLNPGQTSLISVRFTAVQVGPAECTLILGGGAPDVPMIGTGREPVIAWSDPADIVFGDVPIGDTVTASTSILNTGEVPLSLDIGWDNFCPGFEILYGGGPYTLDPGRSRSVTVRFAPTEPASYFCNLDFGWELPTAVVSGAAFYSTPVYAINPSIVNFPITDVGTSRTQVVQVTNQGDFSFLVNPQMVTAGTPFSLVEGGQETVLGQGESLDILVQFSPPANGYYSNQLFIGTDLPVIDIDGTGGVAITLCDVSASELFFQAEAINTVQSIPLTVTNLGNIPLTINPVLNSDVFSLIGTGVILAPGEQVAYQINYLPTAFGAHYATLILGPAACTTVSLQGTVGIPFDPDENLIGFFFDPNFNAIESGFTAGMGTIPVYLAMINPSETSGVGGWECRIATTGGASLISYELAGSAVNASNPNDPSEFTVGIGLEPLPYSAAGVLLATFQLYVDDPDPNNVTLELHPKRNPSLPGMMAWVPWSDFEQITGMIPYTGQATVAWLNTGVPVGLEMPSPLVFQSAGQVELEWPSQASNSDGYHVYRKDPQGHQERLTSELLPATTVTVRFTDQPDYPAGTVLHYSYAAVRAGAEISRSKEVAVTVKSLPQYRTALLANVPNPFNPQTQIRFQLSHEGHARVTIYDVTGRRIRTLVDGQRNAGDHQVIWQGRDDGGRPVASGTYYIRLESNGGLDHRKIMMLK